MKVAVTGGAGFLGRAVAQALAKNDIETLILDTSIRLASLKKDGHSYSTKKLEYPKVQGAEALFKPAALAAPSNMQVKPTQRGGRPFAKFRGR